MSERMLGDVLVDMILYGDVCEATWPDWFWKHESGTIGPADEMQLDIAATIYKLTHDGPGGSCSINDMKVAPLLRQLVPGTKNENPER